MFLDDELINVCLDAEINEPDDVQLIYNKLIDTCQDYYKNQVHINMPKREVKVIIDRTFKLWDSFVRTAVKHNNPKVNTIGLLCGRYTFKDAFMRDGNLSTFYLTHLTNED